jgi:hypothetical protein
MSRTYFKAAVLAGAVLAVSAASAATVGPFVEASAGMGSISTPNKYAFTNVEKTSRKLGGFAWRVAAGYNFMKYVGVEAAYMRPAQSTYKANDGQSYTAKLNYTDNVTEALVDGYLPVGHIDFYGKAGVAYISQKVAYSNTYSLPVNTPAFNAGLKKGTFHRVAPVLAIGAGYNVTPSVMINAGYNVTLGAPSFKKKSSAVANTGYVGLGVRYTFPMSKSADANA